MSRKQLLESNSLKHRLARLFEKRDGKPAAAITAKHSVPVTESQRPERMLGRSDSKVYQSGT